MSATQGAWGPVFDLPNVAIHTTVLPNGLALMWGRRDKPTDDLDVHECTPFLWDPRNGQVTETPQPTLADGTKVNLFCSGHAFLPDGRLLVVGGHLFDGAGVNQASLYDPASNAWTPTALMNNGRWYPTATTLPDGRVLVLSGSFRQGNQTPINDVLQVWKDGAWSPIISTAGEPLNFIGLPLYPRMHVASDGRVFMSGPLEQTFFLRTSDGGLWTPLDNPGGKRANGFRDYCPAVIYDVDKVIYIGGGNDQGTHEPTAAAEVIDLSQHPPRWRSTQPMKFRRRQHNATVLPDGTVLVTGGTRGGGGPNGGFNDLQPGQPVHAAELWDPATESWTDLAAEAVDRCYHSTAVLLPDATVLSAGGGEYRPDNVNPNNPEDSKRNAQIFSPPYLFKGARPDITSAPRSVSYGVTFDVGTSRPDEISKVSWVRLPSVTHSFDQNQRIVFLRFQPGVGKLQVTAPQSPNVCPPGHYMMFVLNRNGVPSVASFVQIRAGAVPGPFAEATESLTVSEPVAAPVQIFARRAAVVEAAHGTSLVVGITGTCPYGIGACWGGAYEALSQLEGVDMVNPIPDTEDSTAEVFLKDERLPPLDRWGQQFPSIVNGTYELRGVEVTLRGDVEERDGQLLLTGGQRPSIQLVPLEAEDKIQWDHQARTLRPLKPGEAEAFERLSAAFKDSTDGRRVTVTGPLKQADTGYRLHVRLFKV